MKRTVYLLLAIVSVIFIVLLTLQNTSSVSVNLFTWTIETSLALLIFSLFSAGIIVAIFIFTPAIIALKFTLRKEKKIISELQKTKAVKTDNEVEEKSLANDGAV